MGSTLPSQNRTRSLSIIRYYLGDGVVYKWPPVRLLLNMLKLFTTPYKGHMTTPCQVPRISGII